MPNSRQVYLLDPQQLPPETIAVTFAKTSRSPQSFKEIASELTDEKSSEFHEKWVVGYGHSSVAEHAVLHIAVENISRLAVECLESNRLASYTEKSTRYQKWNIDSFYIPAEFQGSSLEKLYIETNQHLFIAYLKSLPALQIQAQRNAPKRQNETDSAWEKRIRASYVDVARFLLPASALANVGITINARALEHALKKMLSHPLDEVRQAGNEIKQVSLESVPTLIKYANAVPYWMNTSSRLENETRHLQGNVHAESWCRLVDFDPLAEKRVLAALLYRFSHGSYDQIWQHLHESTPSELERLAALAVDGLEKFDIPLRELEAGSFLFELVMDQGAFFELKRHRIMTQTAQPLTADLGYAVPTWIKTAGFEGEYHLAMKKAYDAYQKIAEVNPDLAAYVVPNAFNRRILLQANYRSLDHLISLRSAANAHFSVRRIAHRMAEEIRLVSPLSRYWIRENQPETWQNVEDTYFDHTAYLPE